MAEMMEMRVAYCNKLLELGEKDDRVCILDADLMKSHGTMPFKARFPERAIDCGVAEANMVGVAAGLCVQGFIPYASTFGCFASRRVFDQFFLSGNYAQLNIKLVGSDPGVTAELNGGTHMPFEDIGLMRTVPGLVIAEPSDGVSVGAVTELMYKHYGCCYLRLQRKPSPVLYAQDEKFEIGKAKVLREGKDVAIVALGAVEVNEALKAADELSKQGIECTVVDAIWVKPLDCEMIRKLASECGKIITCENHQAATGLGSAVADLIVEEGLSCRLKKVGIKERFGQVGKKDFLIKDFNIDAESIINTVKSF